MPNMDKTGPQGQGQKTGRQEGNCEGAEALPRGQGMGRGRGCHRGMKLGRGRQ